MGNAGSKYLNLWSPQECLTNRVIIHYLAYEQLCNQQKLMSANEKYKPQNISH